MIKKVLFVLVLFIKAFPSFSQTGPAGVGTSSVNVLWLKADAGVSSSINNTAISHWNDQSGNSINVTQTVSAQQPSFSTNVMNGYPAIQFDNVNGPNLNDKLVGPDSPLLDNTSGYTFFTVTQPHDLDGNARAIVSKRTTVSVDESFMLFYYTSNKLNIDIQTTDNRFASNATFSNGINYITGLIYDGTVVTGTLHCTLYEEEIVDKNAAETNTFIPDNASPLLIGTTDAADSRPYGGYISEIIIYREALYPSRRIIINNYLSAKYNIALSNNDKYTGDSPVNGDYDREVAGIGQESTGSNPSFSASVSGGLTLAARSGLDDGDYLMAGHAVATNSSNATDVGGMSGANNARWQRVWYVDVTNTATSIIADIEFDMSDGGMGVFTLGSASDYVLLYRAGQSGSWTELASATSTAGDVVQFHTISLTADGYYTIGTRNFNLGPLPIELLYFNAVPGQSSVDLNWATASEKNAKSFMIEKTKNGLDFEFVCSTVPAGESTSKKTYLEVDSNPYRGISYYRLKEISNDNTISFFPLVAVSFYASRQFIIFPNPSEDVFNIQTDVPENSTIKISVKDLAGKICFETTAITTEKNQLLFFETKSRLSSSIYVATISVLNITLKQKIILK